MSRWALMWICWPAAALAQANRAELSGVVRDPLGGAVAGAAVSLARAATGTGAAAVSDAGGAFHLFALPSGEYELAVSHPGFASWRREGLTVRGGERIEVEVVLVPGARSESVVVTDASPLLQGSRGTVSYGLDRRQVALLPLDGRNFVPLLALAPGVSLPPGQLLPRINGSRPRVNEYLYDGISVLQPEPGQVAFFPIVDAIEELRVETNSSAAEYGRSNGGVILVNQRSGSNATRGTWFEFFRHEALNARNLFATVGPKPEFRRNQYGFVLGGPLRRNKTFYFADWQGTRSSSGAVRLSTVPGPAERSGLFPQPVFDPQTTRRAATGFARDAFPANTIPRSRFDPAAVALAERYAAPNVAAAAVNNYRRVGRDATAQDQFDLRVDHHWSARHRGFVRYAGAHDESLPAALLADGSGAARAATRAGAVAAEYAWNVTPASLNQVRFGHTRRSFGRSPLTPIATYDVTGFPALGPAVNNNARFATSVTQIANSFAWGRGGHLVKAGLDLRRERLDAREPANPRGYYQFTGIFTAGLSPAGAPVAGTGHSLASFLLGQVTRFSADAQAGALQPRATVAEYFLQDDWRMSRRFSVNAGVRYTLNFPSTVVGNRGAVFNLRSQRLDYLGREGSSRSARQLEKLDFGPRAGLAWRLGESLVLRSGYGLTWIEQAGVTTPFTTPLFPFVQTLVQQTPDNLSAAFLLAEGPTAKPRPLDENAGLGQGVFGVQRDNGSGYAQQWNVSLQQTWKHHWSLEVGYLGSKLTRLGVPDTNLNQLTVEQLREIRDRGRVAEAGQYRPYPGFQTVTLYRNNVGHSTYHSLQCRIEKRFSRGLAFSAAYTFSRLIDDAGAVFDAAILTGPVVNYQAADSFNRRLEKDVSTGSLPHVFASNVVYEWRSGWRLAAVARRQSGGAVAVTQATNFNAFAGFGIQRPNRLADPRLPGDRRSIDRYFDTGAFSLAPQFTLGSSSRNPVTGPGYGAADVMIGKTFSLGERLRAEVRAEAFNVTNSPPLGSPNGSFGTAAFGSVTTALDPRVFEFVFKLHF